MAAPLDKRLVQRAAATRVFLVAVVATGVGTAILVIAQAWLIAHAVGKAFDRRQQGIAGVLPGLWIYAVGLLAVFAVRAVLTWLNSWLGHRASAQVKSQLRRDVMAARLARPADASTPSGTLITLVSEGLNALDGYFAKFLPQLAMAVIIPILVGIVILMADWPSAIICILTVPLIPLFMALIGWRTEAQIKRRFKVQTRLANHFADLVAGLATLQVFGRAGAQSIGLKKSEDANRQETLKTLRVAFLSAGVLELLSTLSVALVAVTIGFRVVFGHVDLTTSLFVLVLAPEVFLPVRHVGTLFHDSSNGQAAAGAALDFIDASKSVGGQIPSPDLSEAAVVFDQVSLTYPKAAKPSLNHLDLTITPGEVTALVGPSGGGKSTSLALLMGFVSPTEGTITVGGVNLADLNITSWRAQLAYVAQEPAMIAGTIADNVRLGFADATTQQLRSSLDRAGGMRLALDRHVGDDAEGLSSGERRRVALARALLRIELGGARLLVLDEPTAGLDQQTETQVISTLRAMGVGALIVTHRDALLAIADRTVRVEPAQVSA